MTAITIAYTTIADSAVNPDAPVDTTLMTALRNNSEYVKQWMGQSYLAGAVQDHNHDGVNSATTNPPASVGASLVLLSSKVAAAVSTLAFTSADFDWTKYDEYWFQFTNITMVSNNNYFTLNVGTGAGPTWDTGAANYEYMGVSNSGTGGEVDTYVTSDSKVVFPQSSTQLFGNAAAYAASGWLYMMQPFLTAPYRLFAWDKWKYRNGNNQITAAYGAGNYSVTGTALTGIRFGNGGGNWSGGVRAFGIKNS